ncbi:MAG: response regulator transcription factor, partial [Ilumatobacteraceae bacterium]
MGGVPAVRLIVADDTFLTRRGISALLRDAGHDVVAETHDVPSTMVAVEEHLPELLVLDIRMPPSYTDEGLVAADAVRRRHPSIAVLVLSHHLEPAYALALLEAHPVRSGYLLKDRIVEETPLLQAIDRLAAGECVVDPEIVSRLIGTSRRRDPIGSLTPRERDVLTLLAEGRSNAAIGALLSIAERTVESHSTQIFTKLGIEEAPS